MKQATTEAKPQSNESPLSPEVRKWTYNSWRGMKQRCEKYGIQLDQRLVSFEEFVQWLGPRIEKSFTLDRIDPQGGYVVGNLRWASKKIQALNKTTTLFVTYQGQKLPLKVWAEKLGLSYDTLYKRKKEGWTDAEVVEGKKNGSAPAPADLSARPWPQEHAEAWEEEFREYARPGEPPESFYLWYSRRKLDRAMQRPFQNECAAPDDVSPELQADINAEIRHWISRVADAEQKYEKYEAQIRAEHEARAEREANARTQAEAKRLARKFM